MTDFDELARQQKESWEKLEQKHQAQWDKLQADFERKMEKLDTDLEASRKIARETMSKIVALSTSIVGFSATLLSIKQLDLHISPHGLRLSWLLFTLTIALGLLIPYLESRAKYVIAWRGIQEQEWDRLLTRWEKFKVFGIVKYSVLIAPRNLIYCKIYKTDDEKEKNARRNALAIHYANKVINFLLFAELLFIFSFVAALLVLIYSVIL